MKTYRLWQYIDVEVEDESEVLDGPGRVCPEFAGEFVASTLDPHGIGCVFLGEDVGPYCVGFVPNGSVEGIMSYLEREMSESEKMMETLEGLKRKHFGEATAEELAG